MFLIISIVTVAMIVRCSKKCTQQNASSQVVVVVDDNGKRVKKDPLPKNDELHNLEGSSSEDAETANSCENHNSNIDRVDNQSKKPTFQQKR
jgi:predicted lipase